MGKMILLTSRELAEKERILSRIGKYYKNENNVYEAFINSGIIEIASPEIQVDSLSFIGISNSDGRLEASSIKPGNVRFNLKGVLKTVGRGGLELTAAIGAGIDVNYSLLASLILVFIDLRKNVKDVSTIRLDEKSAYMLLALWEMEFEENSINIDEAYNYYSLKYGKQYPLTQDEYTIELSDLVVLGCVDVINGRITIKETISYEYE